MSKNAFVVTLGKGDENQRLLAEALRDMDYEVETAENRAGLSDSLSDAPAPDLSIIDIDGYDPRIWEISQRLAKESIPVLVVTTADADRVRAEANRHGIDAVLSKPLDTARLTATLDSLLDTR